ncbi:FG-GAP repeat protein [Roseateles sp. BYS78W]|uniref:FG-GAP repeat protein n=1 Tax=Pelomonas candidula TaxID=3299025 RepID=A0ABW7H8P7_9BURK
MSRALTWPRLLPAGLALLLIAGCGGGGGGGGSSTPSTGAPTVTGWSQQAYVKAPNAATNANFGFSMAVSGDTLVVGAVGESSNQTTITNGSTASTDTSAVSSGAAYVFVRNGTTWSQQAYLKAPNAEQGDKFGISVGISGDTIVVGASSESSNQTTITNGSTASADSSASDAGAAYVFVRSGTTWSQQAYLKAPNASGGYNFGDSVAISGDTIVVGSAYEASSQTSVTNGSTASADTSAPAAGAAYVFVRSGTSWSQQAYLKAANANAQDLFGSSVAVNGDTIVVGAPYESSSQATITNGSTASADNSAAAAGAAYVFLRNGTTWSQQAYLKAANAVQSVSFGMSVAISGETIVVGTPYEGSSQTTITNGSTASADNSAYGAGAAYVFLRSGTTWSQQAYLKPSNNNAQNGFGIGVAISGDTVAVGAFGESSNQATITNGNTASADHSLSSSGAGYVFVRNSTTWSQQAYLKAPNPDAKDRFGYAVAVYGDTIAVGATGEASSQATITNGTGASSNNSLESAGAAYVFKRGT